MCPVHQGLHRLGLVDEYRFLTFPVILGQGKRLFDAGARPSGVDVVEVGDTGGAITYTVARPTAFREPGVFAVEEGRETSQPA